MAFGQIETELARQAAGGKEGAPARALTATRCRGRPAGPPVEDVIEPLQTLGRTGSDSRHPDSAGAERRDRRRGRAATWSSLNGLPDHFIDNAVAALRLSSLPSVIWWRGGPIDVLGNLIKLADRVILDADPPEPAWKCARENCERAAFSDVRWTRLTRWRALMAQFFDLPEVQARPARSSTVHRGLGSPRRACSPRGCRASCSGTTGSRSKFRTATGRADHAACR